MQKITRLLPFLAVAGLALALPAPSQAQRRGDPEVREARQAYHAALMVQELGLSAEQKTALKGELEEARQIRDRNHNDPEVKKVRKQYVKTLRKATAELEKGGAVSEATQQQLENLEAQIAGIRTSHRAMVRNALDDAYAVLTPEQQQKLRDARAELGSRHGMGHGKGAGMRGGRGGRGGGGQGAPADAPRAGRGRGMGGNGQPGMHMLMNDAFYEALSK